MSRHISPSILAADFSNLDKEIDRINQSKASWLHCDIMDGSYVPNISFGFPVLEHIKKLSKKPLDVHLMIVKPERYIDRFCDLGIDNLTVHIEACLHLHRAVQQIKEKGVKAGVSLNPGTPVESLTEILGDLDFVLVMSVNPGFGGQKLIENTFDKVVRLKQLITASKSHALIQVDGGVDLSNAHKLFDCGVDVLIAGTEVFHAKDPVLAVEHLLNA